MKIVQKRLKSNLLRNNKHGQAAQTPKISQKRQNCLKIALAVQKKVSIVMKVSIVIKVSIVMKISIVMTKQLKKNVHHKTCFLTELVQNNLNYSKLAAKRPKRPKCTKLKIDQKR